MPELSIPKAQKPHPPVRAPRDGRPGLRGPIGPKGDKGEAEKGAPGLNGESAFELSGFKGSEAEWLASLRGEDGRSVKGDEGARGPRGPKGSAGEDGEIGQMPRHEWQDTRLRFETAPDEWGKSVELRGPQGFQGQGGRVSSSGGSLTPSGVTPGDYTNADITVDINGIVTQAANGAAGGGITALTGDVTASGSGSVAATLANTAVTPGAYTNADITIDAKGRITLAANGNAGSGTGNAYFPAGW